MTSLGIHTEYVELDLLLLVDLFVLQKKVVVDREAAMGGRVSLPA
jgi:hypothetical protein